MWVANSHFLRAFLNKASLFSRKTMLWSRAWGTLLPLVRCLLLCVNLVWFKCMLRKKWTPFLRNLFSRHYYQWNGGAISPEIKYVVSNKMCWKTKKKSHLQHWQSSKALQKIGPFYSWYLSLINFIMHNQSFYFLTIFWSILIRSTESMVF